MLRTKGSLAYLVMVFLNAFIDFSHKTLIQHTIYLSTNLHPSIWFVVFINACMLLPYLLLFTPSGFIADKFKKTNVLRITAIINILCTLIAAWSYSQGHFVMATIVILLLSLQNVLNSPAKYGYIKEQFGNSDLARGNAIVQAAIIAAIISSTFIFSLLFNGLINHDGLQTSVDKSSILQALSPAGYLLILLAIIESVCTFLLPSKSAADSSSQYHFENYVKAGYLREYLNKATRSQVVLLCMVGLGIFWGITQVLLFNYGAFLQISMINTSLLFAQSAVIFGGIGMLLGAIIIGRVSRGFIETSLIPIAAFGICLCILLLTHVRSHFIICCLWIIYGIFGGFIVVPLNALIQFNARDSWLGKTIASNNFLQACCIASFVIISIIYRDLGGNMRYLLYLLCLFSLGCSIYIFNKLPQVLIRYLLYFLFSKFYRLNVNGLNNLPSSGSALLLGNHISFFDWAILQVASPRPIRFVLTLKDYDKWYFRWLLKKMNTILINSEMKKDDIRLIRQALIDGDLVALFPENRLCRNGQLGHFYNDFEEVVKNTDAPIIPFYLLGLWGAATTHATEHYKKLSKSRTRAISVSFGNVVENNMTALELKQKIIELSIVAWKNFVTSLGTIPDVWLDRVKQIPRSLCLIDSMGLKLNNIQLFSTVLYARQRIKHLIKPSQNVGVLLPAGAGGIIANLTVLMMGKTVVNLNYTANEKNIKMMLADANIKSVITAKPFLKRLEEKGYSFATLLSDVSVIYIEELSTPLRKLAILRNMIFIRLMPLNFLRKLLIYKHNSLQTATIMFSSGSESKPKGVELTHRNIIGNAKQCSNVFNMEEHDKMLTVLPLFHAFGFTVTTIMPLIEGTPMICHPDPTDVVAVANLITQYKVTVMCATSTFLGMYCRNKKLLPPMLASLRLVIAGAEKLSEKIRHDFKQKFDLDIYEGYGTTEVAPVASTNLPDAIEDDKWQVQISQRIGTVGLPLPGTAFKIVDPDTLEELPLSEEGMILIGGTQVMKGYLHDPEKTRQVLVPDHDITWYITGDKGKLDKQGFLTIVDRYSRFAKIGGEMVSLSAVEQRIEKIINNNDIEIMAINVADDKKGEKIILLHTGEIDPKIIREKLAKVAGSNLMIPANYIKVDNIPKLGSGKKDFAGGKILLQSLMKSSS
jgi:acyl-[acyl-carrier-protein]-phospholipid O-acyltransferase/long-chain-fatty-acid--[acyl-carrier-protein] ligase